MINFSRFAAQKHIRGLLNSRWADAHLSFLYCTINPSFNEWYIYKYVCIVREQYKHKQISDRLEYVTHLHQHTWSIHNSYMSRMCIQNITNHFRGLLNSRLLKNRWNPRKLMYARIFPCLQYPIHKFINADIFGRKIGTGPELSALFRCCNYPHNSRIGIRFRICERNSKIMQILSKVWSKVTFFPHAHPSFRVFF